MEDFGNPFASLKSPFYPLWMMEGSAEYGSGDIDAPLGDMVVRDAVASKTLIELPELQGFWACKTESGDVGLQNRRSGHGIHGDEYGPTKVHDLLIAMKDYFDVSSALVNVLGCDLERF